MVIKLPFRVLDRSISSDLVSVGETNSSDSQAAEFVEGPSLILTCTGGFVAGVILDMEDAALVRL